MGQDWIDGIIHRAQLRAQGFYMGVDGAIKTVRGFVPDQIEYAIPGKNPTRMAHEQREQSVFVARKLQGLTAIPYLSFFFAQLKAAGGRAHH